MSARRSFVSGGTGFVGRFIVEDLLAAGHEVTVMARSTPPEGFFSGSVRFVPLALDAEDVSPAIFERADFFVHAAFDHVPGKYRGGEGDDPESFRWRNLAGSVALFEAARRGGVRRLVFLSSRAVYGTRPPGAWLDEKDEPSPDTLYGEVKLAAERALRRLGAARFHGTSLRVTGVYGPAGQGRAHKWTGLFADYLAGKIIEPRVASEVHGEDVAAAVRLVLERAEPVDPVLNVSDLLVDRSNILSIVKRESGSPHALPPAADERLVNAMRTDRLRALGWSPGGRPLLEKTVVELLRSTQRLGGAASSNT
ncbi:NAD(P)-dependent oxidoreductase [Chelativorans sp.]|uniref:NAD-dependent epimerase/dehydratase family protein n=1 Tax=Chelativorans sp. TaxID=2203393 RepID=UPI0028117DBF|nr:NAD(P)-dependent oxidoreductase [Chelativorans sp.]